ncbi:MAG: hypothetical protein FWE82_01995 [Defluviitaleaceae bacterium]|nr:hypothetical protein [Defluviitaleaceae bacterium]
MTIKNKILFQDCVVSLCEKFGPNEIIISRRNCSKQIACLLEPPNTADIYSEYKQAGSEFNEAANKNGSQKKFYLGLQYSDVSNCGRDVLAEKILACGEPDYAGIAAVLPQLTKNVYCFISGASSWGAAVVYPDGKIFSGGLDAKCIFDPGCMAEQFQTRVFEFGTTGTGEAGSDLSETPPRQFMLNGNIPVLVSRHDKDGSSLEFIYFVEANDPDRDPLVWISVKFNGGERKYFTASASEWRCRAAAPELFWDAFASTVIYWTDFIDSGVKYSVPEKKISEAAAGAMCAMQATFSGGRAHYGHIGYGCNLHDNFPPTFIWSFEACCLTGRFGEARRMLDNLFCHALDYRGRFVYRQGENENYGASAAEYGMLLFFVGRYARAVKLTEWFGCHAGKLKGIGGELTANIRECPEAGGEKLVMMCAEADLNERVYAYINNNLWTVRGFESLSKLLAMLGDEQAGHYASKAAELLHAIRRVLAAQTVQSAYGKTVPFRIGYSAVPLTLSSCQKPLSHLTKSEAENYLNIKWSRSSVENEQDLTENTYANYRYYLEMLSSALLTDEEASAIVSMRESLGGELLGMSRLWSQIDDWPVVNYARFLLESGRIKKFILLLYAHTAHHGNAEKLVYYEQVSADGAAVANDCVPSLLTTPIMLAMAFAFEPVGESGICLLKGIPKRWFETGFEAKGLGMSCGRLDIKCTASETDFTVEVKTEDGKNFCKPVKLFLNGIENLSAEKILRGREHISEIFDSHISLTNGTGDFSITFGKKGKEGKERFFQK